MNGETRSCADQILDAIEYGHLSTEETERRVQKLLDNEIAKTTTAADMDMVNACQTLLWELKTHGQLPYEDHSEQIRASVEKEYSTWTRHRRRQQLALRIGSVAAVFLLIMGISLSLHWEWFSGNSTPDGQQYFVQGHEISTEMVAEAIAAHDGLAEYKGYNMDELETYLGFRPNIPQRLTNGLSAVKYTLFFYPLQIWLSVSYAQSPDAVCELSYNIYYFADTENAYVSMEQSEPGQYIEENGRQVYISNNCGRQFACWQVGNATHFLSVHTPGESVKAILGEYIGGT